jgi:hypothetical protein
MRSLAALWLVACGGATVSSQPDAAPIACGGLGGITCPATQYCDYPDDSCGAADGTGVCVDLPGSCPKIAMPSCGCDGTVYGNACMAAQAGVDVSALGGCAAAPGMFACGPGFCDLATQYCLDSASVYTCQPLPTGCGTAPACPCLASEMCGTVCDTIHTGLTLTCRAGG